MSDPLALISAGARRLGSMLSGSAGAAPAASDQDFSSLLERARAGEAASGASISIAKGLELNLSEEQLARLSVAADKAESQGAHRAVVLIDGMALKIDLATRTITEQVQSGQAGLLTEVDAVITVPTSGEKAAPILSPPGVSPAAVATLLTPHEVTH
jgi:hypothetical protein